MKCAACGKDLEHHAQLDCPALRPYPRGSPRERAIGCWLVIVIGLSFWTGLYLLIRACTV